MIRSRIGFAFALEMARPAAVTLALFSGLSAAVAAIEVLGGPITPGLRTWCAVVAGAVPAAWSMALPAAALVGTVAGLSRWVEQGGWTGLRAAGIGGRSLVPALVAVGFAAALPTLGMTTWGEPWVRRLVRRLASDDVAVELRAGPVAVGEIELWPARMNDGTAEEVFLAGRSVVGVARSARIEVDPEPRLVLSDGRIASTTSSWRMSFRRWKKPLRVEPHRIEMPERTTSELAEQVRRTRAAGRDASYEQAVLLKRALHPVAVLLLPVSAAPIATMKRPGLGLAAIGIGYLVAVRLGDHLAAGAGAVLAAAVGPVFVAVVGAVLWARWGDR